MGFEEEIRCNFRFASAVLVFSGILRRKLAFPACGDPVNAVEE
jgi:hypothetical protein